MAEASFSYSSLRYAFLLDRSEIPQASRQIAGSAYILTEQLLMSIYFVSGVAHSNIKVPEVLPCLLVLARDSICAIDAELDKDNVHLQLVYSNSSSVQIIASTVVGVVRSFLGSGRQRDEWDD